MTKHLFFHRLGILGIGILLLVSCTPAAPTAVSQPTLEVVNTPTNAPIASPTPIPEIIVGVVEVDTLNVREGPGTSYPIITSLTKGEKFYILGDVTNNTDNKWLLINPSEGTTGWVTGDQSYITIQKEIVDLSTYLIWQKNVENAKSVLVTSTASP